MEDTGIPEAILNTDPEGTRGVGRPKSRWLDDVEADMKTLSIRKQRLKAQDRKRRGSNSKGG
jgi:hypothetical protein